ncbi:sulfite exporter TauE/SafE family protein [Piscicoccus intestinalis]|uniref:sulfite exporter TauE/SafE family protein n=1 Tax=Piscicoccus intestinalis TaxID=746033 RepID=UPI0008387821|nr:sulfite exporter TauE/SafE family protein [Piscicoccus intestinalis]
MNAFEVVAILLAGVAAGTINTIVGSGSLITFPTLLFFGYPPLVANMSNNVGLVPGGLSGVHGYRRELERSGAAIRRYGPASLLGGIVGAVLLLWLPESVFDAVVPALILVGLLLVVFGPSLQRRARRSHPTHVSPGQQRLLWVLVALTGVYGGYFGAAQGVILIGILSTLMVEDLQVLNGLKNLLALIVNGVAALTFVLLRNSQIDWSAVLLVGIGTLIGGAIGARVGRRLPPLVLRAVIIVVGTVAILRMTVFA